MTRQSERTQGLRVCAVDIGTNSTRSIVADVRPPSTVEVIDYDGLITRLGEGLDASGSLAPEAVERTAAAAAHFVERGRRRGATLFKLVATSAARDARNAKEFLRAVRDAVGIEAQIDQGRREAEMRSVNLGAVRLSERFLGADPPAEEAIHAASHAAEDALRPAVGPAEGRELIGLGGTITTMVAMLKKLDEYDAEKVHAYRLTLDEVEALLGLVAGRPLAERKKLSGLSPARADIIVGGIVIVRALLRVARCEAMRVSTAGILHGIALAAAAEHPPSSRG